MIDEKKIEEAAETQLAALGSYGLNEYEIGKIGSMVLYREEDVKESFKAGINWFLDNIKHNPSEKPKAGKEVIIQLIEDNSWHSALFNGYDFDIEDMNKEGEYSVQSIEITRWLYIDDLLKGGK